MLIFLQTLWLLMVLLAANQGAKLGRMFKLPFHAAPVSEPWLGKNKTMAVVYTAPFCAITAVFALSMVVPDFSAHMGIRSLLDMFWKGVLLGWGAVVGEWVKSFIKRKRKRTRKEGTKWLPDRFDFALGGGIAAWALLPPITIFHVGLLVLLAIPIHLVGNRIGYRLGWRDTPH